MSGRIDAATRDRLLRHIGLDGPPLADAAGLREAVGAFVTRVPFEDLAVQLGESGPLDPTALIDRIVAGGRGGYCFEVNTVLLTLLESLGFEVERREAIVGERTAFADREPTNHLALVVLTPDGRFIAEAGWGEGPVAPLPLTVGRHAVAAFEYELERDGDGWWLAQHEHGSSPGFRFDDRRASLGDFAPHHARLSTSPESGFVRTLLVQRPAADRIVTLRARTWFVDGPGRHEREVIDDADAFATALGDGFGIDLDVLGPERLERLWTRAIAQHEAHLQAEAAAGA
jgi:N-hydroxyarylamine O-acetyltransferase